VAHLRKLLFSEAKRQVLFDFANASTKTFAKPKTWKYDGTKSGSKNLERPKTWREDRTPRRAEKILSLVA
jgi:hypothetical protein